MKEMKFKGNWQKHGDGPEPQRFQFILENITAPMSK